MATPGETLSVVLALAFVVVAAILFVLVPLEVAAPVLPLFLVFVFALHRYRSRGSPR